MPAVTLIAGGVVGGCSFVCCLLYGQRTTKCACSYIIEALYDSTFLMLKIKQFVLNWK